MSQFVKAFRELSYAYSFIAECVSGACGGGGCWRGGGLRVTALSPLWRVGVGGGGGRLFSVVVVVLTHMCAGSYAYSFIAECVSGSVRKGPEEDWHIVDLWSGVGGLGGGGSVAGGGVCVCVWGGGGWMPKLTATPPLQESSNAVGLWRVEGPMGLWRQQIPQAARQTCRSAVMCDTFISTMRAVIDLCTGSWCAVPCRTLLWCVYQVDKDMIEVIQSTWLDGHLAALREEGKKYEK